MITPLKLTDLTNMANPDGINLSDDVGHQLIWVVIGHLNNILAFIDSYELKGGFGECLGGYLDGGESREDNYIIISIWNADGVNSYNLKNIPAHYMTLYYDSKSIIVHLPSLFAQVMEPKDIYTWYIDNEGNVYWATRDHKKTNTANPIGNEIIPSEAFDLKHLAVKEKVKLNPSAHTGYHCFMEQYVKCKDRGRLPWKTPAEKY